MTANWLRAALAVAAALIPSVRRELDRDDRRREAARERAFSRERRQRRR